MKKLFNISIIIFIIIFSSGCTLIRSNQTEETNETVLKVENFIGKKMPKDFSELEFSSEDLATKKYVAIKVKVSEKYFDSIKNELSIFNPDTDTAQIPPEDYGIKLNSFMKKPLPNTKIYISKKSNFPMYLWYQEGKMYVYYLEK